MISPEKQSIIDKLQSSAGIQELNDMQKQTIEKFAGAESLLLLSPTGSGKTLGFLLPLVSEIILNGQKGLQSVILSPSRELSQQIETVFRSLKSKLNAVLLCGGHSVEDEAKKLTRQPDLIIGTPGRVLDHLRRGNLKAELCGVSALVIDEFDKSLEMGFTEEMKQIIDFFAPSIKKRMFVSATKAVELFEWTDIDKTETVEFKAKEEESGLELLRVTSPDKDKIETLQKLVSSFNGESCIVFCNFRESAERAAKALRECGADVVTYHGALEQKDRERALFTFASGCATVLATTDLAARGLDISLVQHVVHFEMPQNLETFTHRNGRTARQSATGSAYLIIYREYKLPDFLPRKLEEYKIPDEVGNASMDAKFMPIYIGRGKKEKISRGDVAGFLMKTAELAKEDVGLITLYDHYSLVAIRTTAIKKVLKANGSKIKGEKTRVEIAR